MFLGNFSRFRECFWGGAAGGGACLLEQGRNGGNKYLFTEIGKLVFYSNLFSDFFYYHENRFSKNPNFPILRLFSLPAFLYIF